MFKLTILDRLLALGASLVITFSVVTLLADYGLPGDEQPMLAQTTGTITN